MNDSTASGTFESLPMPHREAPGAGLNRYRVYKDSTHYKIVEAESVIDALRASGMRQAYRVLRDSLSLNNVLDMKTLTGESDPPSDAPIEVEVKAVETAPVTPVASVQAPPPPVRQETIVEEQATQQTEEIFINVPPEAATPSSATLSNDDVEKLLKS